MSHAAVGAIVSPMNATLSRTDGWWLKRILLGFWAMYFSIVALTNAVDLLDALSVLHWRFLDSTNFDFMRSIVKVYEIGAGPTKLLLAGALAIELVGAVLFWRVLFGRLRPLRALCWSALVWTAFTFMTEFFLAYTAEGTFRDLLLLTIGTALVVALVPDDA
jgi:hypothetical protein